MMIRIKDIRGNVNDMRGFDRVCESLKNLESAVLAFSGGFDSSYLAEACVLSLKQTYAVFVDMPVISERQRIEAERIADALGISLVVVKLGWDDLSEMKSNDEKRCYFCKKAIYDEVKSVAKDFGIDTVVCGDNYDDLRDDRPGKIASSEAGVISPLEDLKISRKEIVDHVKSKSWSEGMIKDTCLATRIPENTVITDGCLEEIEEIEEIIRNTVGISLVRFRHRGNWGLIQTLPEDIPKLMEKLPELESAIKKKELSFRVDPEGYKGF